MSSAHEPVMLAEVVAALAPREGGVYVDGTFGDGGYTRAILEAADCSVIAIDRDPHVQARAAALRDHYGPRFTFLHGCFGAVEDLLRGAGVGRVDGFVLDLGVSSMQLDQAERGFSFKKEGPLDMRMDPRGGGLNAAQVVNTLAQEALADVIYQYGEERYARRIARQIVTLRAQAPFETTAQLAAAVRQVVPKAPQDKIDPATRTFQALRIYVNDELGEVERALNAAHQILVQDGRLVVVTFHSLEDRIVKTMMRGWARAPSAGSRYAPSLAAQEFTPAFEMLTRKAVVASAAESARNPRARSAKLRAVVRL